MVSFIVFMPTIKEYDQVYMQVAHSIASLSKAERLKVGCIITDDNNILSYGYNGTPYKTDNVCEDEVDEKLVSKPEVIHGELNAMIKLIGRNVVNRELTMYVTDSPCLACAIHIYQSKIIKRVVYDREYRIKDGIEFLRKNSITVFNINNHR